MSAIVANSRSQCVAAASIVVLAALLHGCASSPVNAPRHADSTPSETAATANLQLGIAYLQQGQLALAKDKLQKALAQNSRDPIAHSAMGMLSERLGELREADRFYKQALRLAPKSPDVLNNYAVFLCRTGRSEEGVGRFMEVANNRLYGTPEMAYNNAGVCLRQAKLLDRAEASFSRALLLRPNFAEAALQLGGLQLERVKLGEARATVDRFMNTFPATADLLQLAIRVAQAQGDRAAEERFNRRLRVEFLSGAAGQ